MIRNEAEYHGAQREVQYLKDFLLRVEQSPDHPNKELSIIGLYKKMYNLWEELEEYYQVRLSEVEQAKQARKMTESIAASDSLRKKKKKR